MANNKIQVKRTTVSGRTPNTTGSYATNSQYIAAGEFALNMADGILYSSNGSAVIQVGANLTSAHITSSLTLDNNISLRFKTSNTSAYAYFTQQSDDNFVFYSTDTAYNPRAIWAVYANSASSNFKTLIPLEISSTVVAGSSNGSAGQVLTSNGNSPPYWSTVSGGGSVNTAAQYTWTNNHTFSANVSITGSGIGVASNTGSVYFGGISDANWRISRNAGITTKFFYTNNTLDIIAASSPKEGIVFGWTGNSYLEVGYAGTYTTLPVYVGNSSVNLAINSTSIVGNSVAIGSSTTAVFYNYNSQVNASAGDFKSNAYATLGGGGGNYLAFGQQTNFAQWIQSGYSAASPVYYNIILNPLGGNIGIGNTTPTDRLSINGNTFVSDTLTVGTATVNTTNFTGTANNTSFVGSVSAANVVSNAQLSGNLANYVTTTNLTNNLANYQTTAGLSANVATLAANSATYLGNSSGTIANVASWITTNAAAAYTNSVSYTDGKILTANSAITGNAATAYTNATIFASNASNINTGTLAEARLPYRMNQDVRTSDNVEFGQITVTGNLVVSGNVNIIGANNLSISDNMIYLNSNNDVSSPDIGIAGNYNDGVYAHTGIFRDATDGVWKVFDNYTPEPDANVYIDTTNTSFHLANFQANVIYIGNTTVYSTVNTTNFDGTSNNSNYLGGTAAASYQLNSTLNANIASYLPTYTGVVNASTFSVGSSITANSSKLVIGTAVGVQANGGIGSSGQVLTSNGTTVYWANVSTSSASMIRQSYTGDGSTTVFTVTGGYTAGELDVYLNGVKLLNGTDVTVTNGTTFTITPAPMNGATIYAVGFRTTTLVVTDAVLKTGDTMTGALVVGNTTVGLDSITIGNSSVNTSVNSTVFSGTSNNASFLGGTAAASYQLNSTLSANIASYLPTYTGVVNASSLTVGSIVVGNSTILKANGFTANSTGVFDSADNLRSIPVAAQTAAYVLTSSDNGKTISTNADITVNGAVLTPNQVFTVFNNSSANITITAGTNTTMYQAGTANTGNRTLQQRGVATILMVSANAFVISGAGLA